MEFNMDELIDEYLAGTMSAAAREEFQRRMAADPELAARVQLERELFDAIGASPETELRANLREISAKFDSPASLEEAVVLPPRKHGWNFRMLAVLFLAALVAAFFVFRALPSADAVSPAPQPAPAPLPAPQQSAPGTPAENIPAQRPSQPDKAVQKSRPVASAYEPIPKLETYIGSQFRSADFRVSIDAPAPAATFSTPAGKLNFSLSGKTEGDMPAGAGLRILIFSNNIRDFEAMHPMETSALPVSAEGKFIFKKQISIRPGLYYYLIEEEQSGAWMHVGKFQIK